MRATRAHTKNRRSHHALKGERLSTAKESGVKHPRHKALLDGTPYRGRSVMDTTTKRVLRKQKNTTAPAEEKAKGEKGSEAPLEAGTESFADSSGEKASDTPSK